MGESNGFPIMDQARAMPIHEYAQLKEATLSVIGRLRMCGHNEARTLADLESRLRSDIFHLLVVGQFKRGKTCLLNALLGVDLLPVAVIPLTSIVTILRYGDELTVQVRFLDGREETVGPERLVDFVTEGGNPRNEKGVREVFITYPSPYLKDGVRLIDTPGVGSVYRHNTDVAYQYLPKADAALFLLSVEQPASQSELDFLKDVRRFSGKIFFLLNKIDYLSEPEMLESLNFAADVLREALETDVRVYPISAKSALEGKIEGSDEKLAASRLPMFTSVLEGFLTHEKGKTLLLSITGHLLRIASQRRLEMELELKSVAMPLEELRGKISIFESRRHEMLKEKERLGILLDGEIQKVIHDFLDPELQTFKNRFMSEMSGRFDAFYEGNRNLGLKELDESLAQFVVQEVERAYGQWVVGLEERLSRLLAQICDELAQRVTAIVESLQAFSSDLFNIPFRGGRSESKWRTPYVLSLRLHEEPVGLEMLAASLTQYLPGLVSRRFEKIREAMFRWARRRIFDSRKSRMLQAVDMQAGQVRHHFLDRLKRAKDDFHREMLHQIDEAMEGIAGAIDRGVQRRSLTERETADRQSALFEEIRLLSGIEDEIESIREKAMLH
jgi:GTPase SAR1 family protein